MPEHEIVWTDAAHAAVDLIGRTGARGLEIGYLHDGVPIEEAAWYAHAQYKGARVTEENHPGPASALDALARILLTGAKCKCGALVQLSDLGAFALINPTMADGSKWSVEEAQAAGLCRWRLIGQRWQQGCEALDG